MLSLKNKKITKNFFEKEAWEKNLYCCGIDEVGRGCLAGPIVTACAILPINKKSNLLKDSKILTEQQRLKAYDWIIKNCFYSVAINCHQTIDKLNIYQATLKTMHKAVVNLIETKNLDIKQIKYILIDAMPLKVSTFYSHENLETHYFNYGESLSSSIAAASIVAKVTRDNLMKNISKLFPGFNLDVHKGYATREHYKAIKDFGVSIIHRKTFLTKNIQETDDLSKQQRLF